MKRTIPFRMKSPTRLASTLAVSMALAPSFNFELSAETIDKKRDAPIRTSQADSDGGDVNLTKDGAIALSGTEGVSAITLDSNHNIENAGKITVEDTNNVVGIDIKAGYRGNITSTGQLNMIEDYKRKDEDKDKDLDGPLAIGSNRVGILLREGGTHTGNITTGSASQLTVEGNNSAAIQLRSALVGNITHDGSMSVIGDTARGVEAKKSIDGNVLLSGTIRVQGEDAVAARFDGDIRGALTVESAVSATGFASTSASNYIAPRNVKKDTKPVKDRIDAEDLKAGGAALEIHGSVAEGLLINGLYDDFRSQADRDDKTKDTIEDYDENRATGSVTSFGSGPAISITADTNNLVLGKVREYVRDTTDDDDDKDRTELLATFDYEYGLINRGTINATGLNVGFSATGIKTEGSDDGQFETRIEGGMFNKGRVRATAREADAIALNIGQRSDVGRLHNTGTLNAQTATTNGHVAKTISIAQTANLSEIQNSGTISASASGESGRVIAIQDNSGTLRSIVNTNRISARTTSDGTVVKVKPRAVAIDLSSHDENSGVTLTQERKAPTEDKNNDKKVDSKDEPTPSLIGDVLFGAGNDRFTSTAGTITGNVAFGKGDDTFNLSNTRLRGDVDFGVGAGLLSLDNSKFDGKLSFGPGASELRLRNSSEFDGALSAPGTGLSVFVDNSKLAFSTGTELSVDALKMTGKSVLEFNISKSDTANPVVLNVNNTAEIGEETRLKIAFDGLFEQDFSTKLISAKTLNFAGDLNASILAETPFIYQVGIRKVETERTDIVLDYQLKTAQQLGLDANQTAGFDALVDVFKNNEKLGAALTKIRDAKTFQRTYNGMMPHATDGLTRFMVAQSVASHEAIKNAIYHEQSDTKATWNPWVQEFFTHLQTDAQTNTPGYDGNAIGFAYGMDRRLGVLDKIGLTGNFSSGDFTPKTRSLSPVSFSTISAGLYLQEQLGAVKLAAIGQVGKSDFTSKRSFTLDQTDYEIDGEWSGLNQAYNIDLSTRFTFGSLIFDPAVSVDYFSLNQNDHTETGHDKLSYEIQGTRTNQFSTTAGLTVFAPIAVTNRVTVFPEAEIAYRAILDTTGYQTNARFAGAGSTFGISAFEGHSDAIIGGLSFKSQSDMLSFQFGYDLELSSETAIHRGGATLRLRF